MRSTANPASSSHAAQLRLRPVVPRRAQRLLGAAEAWHEPVREREHLRRRAVVLLEAEHLRPREPLRHAEQVLGRGAGERVDRLVVVADDAEVVARAEPQPEQRLLQQVHVLVLVDGERTEALAHEADRDVVVREEPDRELEQILEVDVARGRLALLVLAVHAAHEVGRDRRLVVAELREVALGRDPPVLRPFDLRREIGRRPELVRTRERVRDAAERQHLRRHDLADAIGRELVQLSERRGMEGADRDARRTEALDAPAKLACGLVRERDREDLVRAEGSRRDLVRDPVRERRRLAGSGSGEDAHGPANGVDRTPLLGVQLHSGSLGGRVDGA